MCIFCFDLSQHSLLSVSIFTEEEWKRYYESLSEGYKAVGFSYDYYGQQIPFTEEGRFTVRGRARGGG